MTASTLLTADDLERMPDDGNRYELVRGVLKQMPPTSAPHLVVTGRLIGYLNQYLEEHNDFGDAGGEGGFVFEVDPDTVLSPDIAVILVEQMPQVSRRGMIRVVPPLVAEVLSPTNHPREIDQKVQIYLQSGVRLVWVVDPEQRHVWVHTPDSAMQRLSEADDLTGGDVLTGFRLPLSRLFRRLLLFGRPDAD